MIQRIVQKSPSILRSLQYFEAVARLGSVTAAAAEHRVTASAVSHQLRELTRILGEDLVVRHGRGVRVTENGERLFEHVTRLFASLDTVIQDIVGQKTNVIRVAVCSSFGPAWLAKQLPSFQKLYPDIEVEVRLYTKDPMQTESVADAIVTAGSVDEGFDSITLFEEMLVAVGGKNMALARNGCPQVLITTDLERGRQAEDWQRFSQLTDLDYVHFASGGILRCTHYVMALAMAQSGPAAALVPDYLAEDALARGDLVLLSAARMPAQRTYRLCYKTSRANDPVLRCFAQWVHYQMKFIGGPLRLPPAEPEAAVA